MKTIYTLLLLSGAFSNSALAQDACTLKINLRTHFSKVSAAEVSSLVDQIASDSDIKIVDTDSDYTLEVYGTDTIDHHNSRYIYSHGNIKLWPSNQIQDRSSIGPEFSSGFMRARKFKKQIAIDLLTKSLNPILKSCASLDQLVKSTGNGTLNPVDGSTYVTKTGFTFKRVGTYWKDPSGLQWGEILPGEYANANTDSPAVKACAAQGARLPTLEDFKNLLTYFPQGTDRNRTLSPAGQYEFNALFPWSFGMYTTATRSPNGVGYDFHHLVGIGSPAMEHWELNVRCVR